MAPPSADVLGNRRPRGERAAHRRRSSRLRADVVHPGLHRRPGRAAHLGPGDGRGGPPRRPPPAPVRSTRRLLVVSPAAVDLYAVGVHWALGDAGAALDAGKNLRPDHFSTAERKARVPVADTNSPRVTGRRACRASQFTASTCSGRSRGRSAQWGRGLCSSSLTPEADGREAIGHAGRCQRACPAARGVSD